MEKNKRYKPSSAIFIIVVVCLVVLFSTSFTSAADWDNVLKYENDDMKVTIINALNIPLLRSDIGTMELKSHTSVNQIKEVAFGDSVVMYYDFDNFKEIYYNGLGEVILTDVTTGEEVYRDYEFVYWGTETRQEDIYEDGPCSLSKDGNMTCEKIVIKQDYEFTGWLPYFSNDIPFEKIRIGIKVDVKFGDLIDGVWTIAGKRVSKHSSWTQSLNVGLISYWKFDEEDESGTGNIIDAVAGVNNGTNAGAENSEGKINTAYFFEKANTDWIDMGADGSLDFSSSMTICAWVNNTGQDAAQVIGLWGGGGAKFTMWKNADETMTFKTKNGAGSLVATPNTGVLTINVWYYLCGVFDDDTDLNYMYINNFSAATQAQSGGLFASSEEFLVGAGDSGVADHFQGVIDEVSIWNRSLSAEEIIQLWNNDIGLQIPDAATPPQVILSSPADNENFTSPIIDFVAIVTDDVQVANVTLFINGVANETNVSGFNGTYVFTKTFIPGIHNWSILGINNQSVENQSNTRTFNFTQLPIVIELNNPVDTFVSEAALVNMSCSASSDDGILELNLTINGETNETLTNSSIAQNLTLSKEINFTEGIYIWGCSAFNDMNEGVSNNRTLNVTYSFPVVSLGVPIDNENFTTTLHNFTFNATDVNGIKNVTLFIDGVANETNSSGIDGPYSFIKNFTDGNYNWSVVAASVFDKVTQSATRDFTIHTVPSRVIITAPNGSEDFIKLGDNQTLSWVISEEGQDLSEHIINCSYFYNEVEVFLTLTQCIVTNETSFVYVDGVEELNFTVVEEFGLTTTNTTTWSFKTIELNQTFEASTTEGGTENFSAFLRLEAGQTISAVALVYNGVSDVGFTTVSGENVEIRINNFIIPGVVGDSNVSFHWSIILLGGEIINLTTQTQLVFDLGVDNCSVFTNQVLNLSMVDEETQTILSNTTIEISVDLLSFDRSKNVSSMSGEFSGENPIGICLEQNLSGSIIYSMDATILYKANGYAIEYYNLVNLLLGNDTGVTKIILFDLNESDSTEFQITFTGEDFLPVEDVLIFLERQYISENTFKTVELPKTDSNGQTVLHMVRNDVIYNIIATKDDEVLGNFLNIIAFCEDFTIGQCAINLNALSNASAIFNYDESVGILYDKPPIYNETTNIVSFSFVSTDGSAKIVTLNVERRDIFGNVSVCDNTVISTSGTVACNIGLNLSDTSLVTTVLVDGEEWIADSVVIDTTGFGSVGYVVWFILAIGLLLMFSDSKNGVLLSIIFSYIAAIGLGLSIGGIVGIGSAGIWILVMTALGFWQINKRRKT